MTTIDCLSNTVTCLTGVTTLAAFCSAIFWLLSAMVNKKALLSDGCLAKGPGVGFGGGLVVDSNSNDVIATFEGQAKWNRIAAGLAALAAFTQTIALLLDKFPNGMLSAPFVSLAKGICSQL